MPTESKRPSVMLVDDHAVVRTGFRRLLESSERFPVVMEMTSGDRAIEAYSQCLPDVVVMDLNLPGNSGLEATRRIRRIDDRAKILIFSIHDESIYVARALAAGAMGYLCKSCPPERMVLAVDTLLLGQGYIDPDLHYAPKGKHCLLDPISSLSPREFEIFQLLGRGLSSRDISESLGITVKTASNYIVVIKEKLSAGSTSELVRIASRLSDEKWMPE